MPNEKEIPFPISEQEFLALNHAIRITDRQRAIEIIIRNTVLSLESALDDSPLTWLQKSPDSRRGDMYALLRVAAKKMEAIADRILAESKRVNKSQQGST